MIETQAKFIKKIQRTPNVVSFRFKTEEMVDFLPGQFLQVIFDENHRGNNNLNKHLSFSCAPNENHIEVTKKLSDSVFSSKLNSLVEGDELLIRAPMGKCTIYDLANDKICFIVGGIGITPVVSILEDAALNQTKKDIVLIYGNWNEKEIAFKNILDEWNKNFDNIRIEHVLAEGEPASQHYSIGMINKDIIHKKVSDIKRRSCFIFGPPKMVDAMKEMCENFGIDQEQLKTESFIGY